MGLNFSNHDPGREIKSKSWIDKKCSQYSYVKLQKNTILTIDRIKGIACVLGSTVLQNNFKFTIRVDKIYNQSLGVGIGISDQRNVEKFCTDSFTVYLSSGKLRASSKDVGQFASYTNNDCVSVGGCLRDGLIEFEKNGAKVGAYQYEKMKDIEIKWVPYLFIPKDSCLSIIQNVPSNQSSSKKQTV